MDLAHILKNRFNVPDDAIADAHHILQTKGGRLSDILVQRQAVTETQMLEAMSIQYEIPFWPELPMENIGSDFANNVSIQFLKRHHVVPLAIPNPSAGPGTNEKEQIKPVYIIAVNDPGNFSVVDDLVHLLGLSDHKLVISSKQAILAAINLRVRPQSGFGGTASSEHGG